MLAAVLRGLISSALIVVLALLFGAHIAFSPLFLAVLVLNCIIFAEIGFLAAMKISTYEEMGQVNTYILLPMSFLCGTFFSTHALPAAVRIFIELLPLTHTSYLLRGLGTGTAVSSLSLLVLLAYALFCFVWGCRAFSQLRR